MLAQGSLLLKQARSALLPLRYVLFCRREGIHGKEYGMRAIIGEGITTWTPSMKSLGMH